MILATKWKPLDFVWLIFQKRANKIPQSSLHLIYVKHTVVKWGHTEGIEREKTSSKKSNVIELDFWWDE